MPLPAARLIQYERLATPREHLGVLIEPAVARIHAALRDSPVQRYGEIPFLDTTLGALRAQTQARLKLAGPVILSGHQAEFIHAGVFAKTIAAHALAGPLGGQAVILTVHSDDPQTPQLALPQTTPAGLRRVEVTIPGCDPQWPFELQTPRARTEWLQFFASLGALYELHDRSMLGVFARAWLTTEDAAPRYCDALARAQAATESALGLGGVRELRMSELCTTPEFRAFVAAMLRDARRCATVYNAAQAAYRQRHRVRARGRPVPPLLISSEAVELPCWVIRRAAPRRRLFATARGEAVELSTENAVIGSFRRAELARLVTHAEVWPIENAGWQLRPRALTLSAFARLFLADLFIHGVGGAKYDEMMEDFIGDFLGVQPAPACCVTATVHLPLPHSGVTLTDIMAARRNSRDLRHNPCRHLHGVPDDLLRQRAELVRHAQELRAHQPQDHARRRVAFREIRRLNERMLELDPWRAAEYDQRIAMLEEQWKLDRIALDREYFYALHVQDTLEQLVEKVRTALQPHS